MSEAQQQESAPQEDLAGMILNAGEDEAPEEQPEQEAAEAEETAEVETDDADDESVSFDERQQKKLDQIIARNSARYKAQIEAEQRQRQEIEQRLQQLEQGGGQQQSTTDPETGAPVIPQMPDVWDTDYEQKLEQRDSALRQYARWEAQQEVRQYQQQQEMAKLQEQVNQETVAYVERCKDYGLTPDDIRQAGEFILSTGGIDNGLAMKIVRDEAGPAITHYLYRNPEALQKVREMNPYDVGDFLAREIRPKAVRNAKRKTAPPPPVFTESGSGAREDEMPEGAMFL